MENASIISIISRYPISKDFSHNCVFQMTASDLDEVWTCHTFFTTLNGNWATTELEKIQHLLQTSV